MCKNTVLDELGTISLGSFTKFHHGGIISVVVSPWSEIVETCKLTQSLSMVLYLSGLVDLAECLDLCLGLTLAVFLANPLLLVAS